MKLIIAEKPSVARDIASVLGIKPTGRSYFRGQDYIVTWAIGHLVTLAEPHLINPSWQKWRESDLPILPSHWPLSVLEGTSSQFQAIKDLLDLPEVRSVIAATDAGREGELIFRYIYEKAGSSKPVERLWLSSLTPESITSAMKGLRPQKEFDGLADNARGRSRADWLVGLNFTRAYSLKQDSVWTVGRVQTPTLAMVVERTEAILNFVAEPYAEIEARFVSARAEEYRGLYIEAKTKDLTKGEVKRFSPNEELCQTILSRVKLGEARVVKREDKQQKIPPPKLYDLTELQKDANRLFGFQAKYTLDIAQSLYETHKLLTYPRSDSRYLSTSVAKGLPAVVAVIIRAYKDYPLHPQTGQRDLGPGFVNDAKVSDHHAIIPTGKDPSSTRLNADEAKVFDLVAKRLLMAWQDDLIKSQSVLVTGVFSPSSEDYFKSTGVIIVQEGWRALEKRSARPDALALPLLAKDELVSLRQVEALKKETKPPAAFSDATLLNGMASAGSRLDDKELEDVLREKGLGTPATRAATIENLITRKYLERREKSLWATELGRNLIAAVHPSVRSAALTGEWEGKLRQIEDGSLSLDIFMREIEAYVNETIALIRATPSAARDVSTKFTGSNLVPKTSAPSTDALDLSPKRQGATREVDGILPQKLKQTLHKYFGHREFREHQEQICREIIEGEDLLLVMPTGAGKSLCYQLPALSMEGCTLVISPLIALMDDQVDKLKSLGIAAAALHSGLSREDSRAICVEYMQGRLKLLYIAPERLGLSGFADFLAKTPPALIAIDEAHCISQWGHDFRPDYRMLAARLKVFRPAPIVAMTATATPLVQKDIAQQLDLLNPKMHIHGFRRTNIAIEISEVSLPDRPALAKKLLQRENARPAIIYAPTRKDTETVAHALADLKTVAAYHAGLSPQKRQQIQRDFQEGKLDVIVATIAFGMGIDKSNIRTVIHTALPSSVEAYYQEIGRAGRDGKFSRAILLHSYIDHRTREFFVRKNYPDIKVLEKVVQKIPQKGILRSEIPVNLEPAEIDNALEKLWVHGAIEIDSNDEVKPLKANWQKSYLAQQIHKQAEVGLMSTFAGSNQQCRMVLFLNHFGDLTEHRTGCGICDYCLPLASLSKSFRTPTLSEQKAMRMVLDVLRSVHRPQSVTKVFAAVENTQLVADRKGFDALVEALIRAGHVRSAMDSFEKAGVVIHYRTLAPQSRENTNIDWDEILVHEISATEGKSVRKKKATKGKARTEKFENKKEKFNDPLGQQLRGYRLQMAKKEKVPPYRVFSDRTLSEIISERPSNLMHLGEIGGIGPQKLNKYGRDIMNILSEH